MNQPENKPDPASEPPKPEPQPASEENRGDDGLHKINEARWEYDLPELTRDDIREYHRRYMDDKYGYDIDK